MATGTSNLVHSTRGGPHSATWLEKTSFVAAVIQERIVNLRSRCSQLNTPSPLSSFGRHIVNRRGDNHDSSS
jgi:hypothetical protein